MDFSWESWEHNAIYTLPRNVAEKRSNNKLKSWPNIRCRVGTEVWDDYEKTVRQKNGERKKKKEIMHSVSQWAFENPCSAGKVSSKFWDRSQMVHSWREGISFCMYNFEKVTRGADRHERTWEPSRDRRSEEKIRKRRGRASCCSNALIFSLTPQESGDIYYIVCVSEGVCGFVLQTHLQYLSVMHEEEKLNGI